MANVLTDLDIDEISLCDAPANSEIDPATGKKTARARVVIFKRDNGGTSARLAVLQSRVRALGDHIRKTQESFAQSRERLHEKFVRKGDTKWENFKRF